MNMPKYDAANESKRVHTQITHPGLQHNNPAMWQLSSNKDQKASPFPLEAKKEVDQPSESANDLQLVGPEMGTSQISGPLATQVEQNMQVCICHLFFFPPIYCFFSMPYQLGE